MDAWGFLFESVAYFVITVGVLAPVVWHVDAKVAVPWASPWRTRAPKLCAVGGPALFVLAVAITATGVPDWVLVAVLIGSALAPWVGAVLITVEWLRRAEDRATGLTRPERPWI